MEIVQLNKNRAKIYANNIIKLHNMIPYQFWTYEDLFKEKDLKRIYYYKWKISRLAIDDNKVIGFCVSFYNASELNNKHLYIHRLSVLPKYRLKGIGKALCIECCKAFLKIVNMNECNIVFVQSPIDACLDNSKQVSSFYRKIGFKDYKFKKYQNKSDIVFKANISSLIKTV